jgi:putative copper export protein
LEFISSGIDYTSSGQEHKIVVGILCLVLHHSSSNFLIEPAKAIILNSSLVSLTDVVVNNACVKGPSLFQHNQETTFGEFLILVLLLVFFSLRRYGAVAFFSRTRRRAAYHYIKGRNKQGLK